MNEYEKKLSEAVDILAGLTDDLEGIYPGLAAYLDDIRGLLAETQDLLHFLIPVQQITGIDLRDGYTPEGGVE